MGIPHVDYKARRLLSIQAGSETRKHSDPISAHLEQVRHWPELRLPTLVRVGWRAKHVCCETMPRIAVDLPRARALSAREPSF